MRLLLATPLLLSLLAPAAEAAAQSPPTGAEVALKVTVARALLEEGQKLLDAGRFPEAKSKLEASLHNDPTPAAMLALGACHEKLGATASAWGEFKRAAREARLLGDKVLEEEANKRALAIEPRLSAVKLVMTSPAPGTRVLLDDRHELGENTWGAPLPLDPGWHKLEAAAPGKTKFATVFQLSADGGTKEVAVPVLVVPPPLSPPEPRRAEPPSPPAPKPGTSPALVVGVAITAAGGAGIVTGLGIFCMDIGCFPGHGSRIGSAERAVGAVAGLAGLGLLALGISMLRNAPSTPPKSVTSIRLHPVAFGSGAGLGLHATW